VTPQVGVLVRDTLGLGHVADVAQLHRHVGTTCMRRTPPASCSSRTTYSAVTSTWATTADVPFSTRRTRRRPLLRLGSVDLAEQHPVALAQLPAAAEA